MTMSIDDQARLLDSMRLKTAEHGQGNSLAVSGAYLLEHLNELQETHVPIFHIRKLEAGQVGVEPISYEELRLLDIEQVQLKQFILPKDWTIHLTGKAPRMVDLAKPSAMQVDPYAAKLELMLSLSAQERLEQVQGIRIALQALAQSGVPAMEKAKTIVSAVEQTFLINKASLKLKKIDIGIAEKTIALETREIVNQVVDIVEESQLTASLFECFKSLANGQTLNHIVRVFSMMTSFLHYYNSLHHNRLGQNLRLVFAPSYLTAYKALLPNLLPQYYVSDNLLQLPFIENTDLKEYALGAFLHDIGKMANLDYFESDAEYSSQEVRQHVFLSAGLIIMNFGVDHEAARLIAGDHHNALFHKDGYSVTRLERQKGIRKIEEAIRCICATTEDYHAGLALGFLPTEMCAVVDIYDAMTDSSRAYKNALSPEQALEYMSEQPVKAGKLDPVLFDIFVDFLQSCGQIKESTMGLKIKLQQRKSRT